MKIIEKTEAMTNKKTIIFVEANEDGTVGGSYFSLQLLVNCLDKSLYHPIVVLYTDIPLAREMFADISQLIILHKYSLHGRTCQIRFLQPVFLVLRKMHSLLFRLIIPFVQIISILIMNRVALVHLNNSTSACPDWLLAARILRKPCVAHQRGNFLANKKTIIQAKKFNKIFCISKSILQPFEINNISNTRLIYNPIDVEHFRLKVKKDKQYIKQLLQVDNSLPFIGMVGNFQEWKGHIILIHAVDLLRKKFPGIVCLLIGAFPANSVEDKAYFNKVNQLIEKYSLQNNIIMTGFRSDVADYINALDIQLHCSTSPEPFGRVLIEGMCLKKVVVATNMGGPSEIIEDGVSGVLVPPGDHIILGNKISCLLENAELRAQIGSAAYVRVRDNFSIDKFKTEIHEHYQEII